MMELTHAFPNIKELEERLGFDSIEMFLESFSVEMELIDDMAEMKPWEKLDISEQDQMEFEMAKVPLKDHLKNFEYLEQQKQKQTLLG